ncbi:hypothetical protein FHS76_003992 [Ochrobactrum daejeonense]|uniref:Stability/partitioning determinant n=1 Tax=Brucella daejeonensis TaxID=659015 RepID=A0A7W9B0W6_9HYPH|nr:stability/partitioning determinant [Brucella daejeonensis]MBB5704077.1 hypothetical protein [Brucella daejeonensis]
MTRTRPNTFAPLTDDPLEKVAVFQPRTEKPTVPKDETRRIAEASGFSARTQNTALPKVDARSLRSRGRTAQLNINVKPETKDAFWRFASANGYGAGEEALQALLALASPQA